MFFSISGDFNRDGRLDTAETAVGELRSGERVAVLIISSRFGAPAVFVQQSSGFSVIYREEGGLAWNSCMECGHAISIRWSPRQRSYVELVPESYGGSPSNNSFKPKPLRGSA